MDGPTDRPGGARAPAGDLDDQFTLIYDELKRLAHSLRSGRSGATLNTTALVHEVYIKLAGSPSLRINDRGHFFAVAARAMRQILVDAARRQKAQKRGGDLAPVVTFDESLHAAPLNPTQVIALDEVLIRLEAIDPRRARIVEHRLFAGLSAEETAEVLGVSRPTVDRDWRAARAWLAVELTEGAM